MNLDEWEKRCLRWIIFSLGLFFISLGFHLVVHAENDVPIGNYTNQYDAILGECRQYDYYIVYTDRIQDGYYTRNNYYAICWDIGKAEIDGDVVVGDIAYYSALYGSNNLSVRFPDRVERMVLNGKYDIFSNVRNLGYPASLEINREDTAVYKQGLHYNCFLLALVCGLYISFTITTGKGLH